tara:strand:+ start:4055 stop:7069 length:3015 start_codon:yes stop_codon:yes gene_type:complete
MPEYLSEEQIQAKIDLWKNSQPDRNTLSADKTGATITNPIDSQIAYGVDFFDDETSSHTGFVPKTDLESRYHQMQDATIAPAWPDAAVTSEKTRNAYDNNLVGQENLGAGFRPDGGIGLSITSHILDTDVIAAPGGGVSYFGNLLPIEGRASLFFRDPDIYSWNNWGAIPPGVHNESIYPNTNRVYPNFDITQQTTLYNIPDLNGGTFSFDNSNYTPTDPYAANALTTPFMGTPINGFGIGATYLSNEDIPNQTSVYTVLPIESSAAANTMLGTTANYLGTSNLGGFDFPLSTYGYPSVEDGGTILDRYTAFTGNYFEYGTDGEAAPDSPAKHYPINEFLNVPAGLNTSNLFGTDSMRNVSNTGPHSGDFDLHPIIIRNFGTNWSDQLPVNFYPAVNSEFQDPFGLISNLYVNMSAVWTVRLRKWSQSVAGGVWYADQQKLQKLNPQAETRTLNFSALFGDLGNTNADAMLAYTHKARHQFADTNRYEKMIRGGNLPDFIVDNLPDGLTNPSDLQEAQEFGYGSRIAMQGNYDISPNVRVEFSLFGVQGDFEAGDSPLPLNLGIFFANPNRYTSTLSSAPVSIVDGIPSFTISPGTGEGTTAKSDADSILAKQGGTFNVDSNQLETDRSGIAQRYATLAYGRLNKQHSYEKELKSPGELLGFIKDADLSPGSIFPSAVFQGDVFGYDFTISVGDVPSVGKHQRRKKDKKIVDAIGMHQKQTNPATSLVETVDPKLGVIKKSVFDVSGLGIPGGVSDAVDKINYARYGARVQGEDVFYTKTQKARDFIKFRFYDVMNKKYIVFRAILNGIQDSITTDYGEEKYIGRPDKLYIYKGADRDISFSFKVYPKTKQELPFLMEKLNYLIGMCYPKISQQARMQTPFMRLTLGDMFDEAPGLLRSVSVSVDDNTTWELDRSLQFPKHINVSCQFRYIGAHVPSNQSTEWYSGLKGSDIEPSLADIFDSYFTFDLGVEGTLVDTAIGAIKDSETVQEAYAAGKKWVGGLFK